MTNVVDLSKHRPQWDKTSRAGELYFDLQIISQQFRRLGASDEEVGWLFLGEAIQLLWKDQRGDILADLASKHVPAALEQVTRVLRTTEGEPA
jgi:hypothetical protein